MSSLETICTASSKSDGRGSSRPNSPLSAIFAHSRWAVSSASSSSSPQQQCIIPSFCFPLPPLDSNFCTYSFSGAVEMKPSPMRPASSAALGAVAAT